MKILNRLCAAGGWLNRAIKIYHDHFEKLPASGNKAILQAKEDLSGAIQEMNSLLRSKIRVQEKRDCD